jgi:carbonic anhydrase
MDVPQAINKKNVVIMKYSRIAVPILPLILIVGCSQTSDSDSTPHAESAAADETHEVHWGYEGDSAPEYWSGLSPEFALCRDGHEQSPIDLSAATPVNAEELERLVGETFLTVTDRAKVMDLIDNGHTIQITNDVAMATKVDGVSYELAQFHFHAPSEHTIDGQHFQLEVHFVHQADDGTLAVVGMLVDVGEHDSLWEPIIASLPDNVGDERHLQNLDLDLTQLQGIPRDYYRYSGSLTTPPCSEGVKWIVLTEIQHISAEQMRELVSHLHNNNRPIQAIGDRQLTVTAP